MAVYTYPSHSPYALTPQKSWRLGLYAHRSIPPATGDREIVVASKYHNRPDRLSYDLYGSDNYWWVFMVRNMNAIRDPIFDLKAGMTIVVPSLETIRAVTG
jgi:hypothetical protein